MRRIAWLPVGLGLIATTALASASAAGGRSAITVTPSSGNGRSHFAVTFRAPQKTGANGSLVSHYRVSASGGSGRRCESSASVFVPATRRGQHVRVVLVPPGPFNTWCSGKFAGVLQQISRPVCPAGKLCPLFIAIATVGRFSFRVA
jgi:hypothetical protein